MKLVRILYQGKACWAELRYNTCYILSDDPYSKITYSGEAIDFDEKTILAPCTPTKIVCVGKNYRDHALELGGVIPDHPIIFIKPVSSLNRHGGEIIYPNISSRVDFEGELAFIVKQKAKNIKSEQAHDYILGYSCLNDVTARDIQSQDGQWTRAKSFDTFAPVGPVINTDADPSDLGIETRLNGKVVQKSRTSNFMWGIFEIFEFITSCMTLMPGDVVTTGTPAGIGPMRRGDIVEVEIESIGILKNIVIGE